MMSIRSFYRPFWLALLSLLISGCANSGKVFSDYDPNQNFSKYKTFAWSKPAPILVSGTYPVSQLSRSQLREAIETELEAKGFQKVSGVDQADFSVMLTLGARDKITTRTTTEYRTDPYSWRWGGGYYPHYFPNTVPVTTEIPYQFTEGSISLDIFDFSEQRPVWHSSANKRLNRKEVAGMATDQAEAAKALLDGFPPK